MTVGTTVLTDSTSQLSPQRACALGVEIVPATVAVDAVEHDDLDLDIDLFYERLASGVRASTSQPSPGRLGEAYAAAAARGATEIVSIHLDGRVSGTVAAAEVAAADAPVRVRVVDTGLVSFGVAVAVAAAARAAAGGAGADDVVAAAGRAARRVENAFFATGAPHGRVPATEGALLSFSEGRAVVVESCAVAGAADAIGAAIVAAGRVHAAVGYAHRATTAAAAELSSLLRRTPNVAEMIEYRVTPSVGAHTGAFAFGAFWWPSAEEED